MTVMRRVPHVPCRAVRLLAVRLAVVLAVLAAGSLTSQAAEAREHFWESWIDISDFAQRAPDSALVVLGRRLAVDSLDCTALLLRARTLATDSLRGDSLLAHARPDTLGIQANIERGTVLLGRGRSAPGRAAWSRAGAGYLSLGRVEDAARAGIYTALLDRTRRDPTDPAIAAAESLGARVPNLELVLCAKTLAGTRWQQRDVQRALRVLLDATRMVAETGPCYMSAEAERQLAIAYKTLGSLDSARVHYERAVEIARAVGRPELSARCLHSLGTTVEAQARLPEAEAIYRQALEMTPADEYQSRANLLGQLGKLYQTQKRYDEARELYLQSNALYEAHNPRAEGRVLNLQHLGQIEMLNGDFDGARALFEQALAESRRLGLASVQGGILTDLSSLYRDSGDLERAGALLDEALATERRLARERYIGSLLCNRADLQLDQGHADAALELSREAVTRLQTADPAGLPFAYRIQVRALLALHRPGEAAGVADSARQFAEARGDSVLLIQAWELDADVSLADGHPGRALEQLERALPPAHRVGARDLVTRLNERLGYALLATRHPARAAAAFEEALRSQELSQYTLRSMEERSQRQSVWQELYVQLATAYLRAGRTADAFRVVDRSRARGLRETLARELPAPKRDVAPAPLAEVERLRAALEDAQRQLTAQYALPPAQRSAGLGALETRCSRLRGQLTEAELSLERSEPAFTTASGWSRSLGVSAVRGRLGPDEALLAYLTGAKHSLVFVVTPGTLEGREVARGEAALQRGVDSLRAGLTGGADSAWRAPARDLAVALLPNAALRAHGRLFVTPDGPLHLLPFETLLVGAPAAPRCLIELRAIVMGASPSLLFGPVRAARPPPRTLAAFGDPDVAPDAASAIRRGGDRDVVFSVGPLPNARLEVEGIAALFAGARAYVGAQATEAQVLRELERCQMLHVAAHAFVDVRHPRFSGLVLARDSSVAGDGLLQAYEVLTRRGDLELVTLSACETGRGTVQRGEGLLGLARAFRIAGARNLVVSLWPVDDAATADFMLGFYARLAKGMAPVEALAGVKRAMLAGGTSATEATSSRGVSRVSTPVLRQHPASWAAFVLQGEAGPPPAAAPAAATTR